MTSCHLPVAHVHVCPGDARLFVRKDPYVPESISGWGDFVAVVTTLPTDGASRRDYESRRDDAGKYEWKLDNEFGVARTHHTRATLRCDDVFTTLDLLWDMHAAPTVVENAALTKHVNRQIERLVQPGDGMWDQLVQMAGLEHVTVTAYGRHMLCATLWQRLVAAEPDVDGYYPRFPQVFTTGRCGFETESEPLHDVGYFLDLRSEAGWRAALSKVAPELEVRMADDGSLVVLGTERVAEQANDALRELRLYGAKTAPVPRLGVQARRLVGCFAATHDEVRGLRITPGWRAAYEQKRCLHQLRLDLFYGGDVLVTAAQLDGWEMATAEDRARLAESEEVRWRVRDLLGECFLDARGASIPSTLRHLRTLRCMVTKLKKLMADRAGILAAVVAVLVAFLPVFVSVMLGVGFTVAGTIAHWLHENKLHDMSSSLVGTALLEMFRLAQSLVAAANPRTVRDTVVRFLEGMRADLTLIAGWAPRTVDDIRRAADELREKHAEDPEACARAMRLLEGAVDPTLRHVVRAQNRRHAGLKDWTDPAHVLGMLHVQLRKHVLLRPYFHEAELRAAKTSRSATVKRAEHAAVRALCAELLGDDNDVCRARQRWLRVDVRFLEEYVRKLVVRGADGKTTDMARTRKVRLAWWDFYASTDQTADESFPYDDPGALSESARLLADLDRTSSRDCTPVWDRWIARARQTSAEAGTRAEELRRRLRPASSPAAPAPAEEKVEP